MASGPEIGRITYNAYVGDHQVASFEPRWDHIHEHRYPELHGGSQYGATLRQTDLLTGKTEKVGRFELNTDPDLW